MSKLVHLSPGAISFLPSIWAHITHKHVQVCLFWFVNQREFTNRGSCTTGIYAKSDTFGINPWNALQPMIRNKK
jgi:hypothetical protein